MRPVQSSPTVRLGATGTALLEQIEQRRARAGIIGLGYVGLPLAIEFGRGGLQVTGIEIDQRKVDAIAAGISYVPDVPTANVRELRDAGRLRRTPTCPTSWLRPNRFPNKCTRVCSSFSCRPRIP